MLDALPLTARMVPPPPLAALVEGRPAAEVAALLPRLFSLCGAAQAMAGRLALGLSAGPDAPADHPGDLSREILRDHLVKFHLTWPRHLGLDRRALPADWPQGGAAARQAVFGPAGAPPATPAALAAFLTGGAGVAPVLAGIAAAFAPGEAVAAPLPAALARNVFAGVALENSVAARQARHPVMAAVAARTGRGPFWRALGRLYDIAACLDGSLPAPALVDGIATAPAARGLYALRATVRQGRVTSLSRVTPTDHLMAPGGVMATALMTCRPANAALLVDILDPCAPVTLEGGHA